MRKLRLPLVAVMMAAAAFVSCDKNETPGPDDGYVVKYVDFEEVDLPAAGYELKDDNAYKAGKFEFSYTYSEDPWEYEGESGVTINWSGFIVSDNTDKETAGYLNQFSVYGDGGAGGSSQFAVVYLPAEIKIPNEELECVYVTNSTYAYLAIKNGDTFGTPAFGEDDYFKLTVIGYDSDGEKKGSVDFYLADYRDGKDFICSEWTRIDLQELGVVSKIKFELETTVKNSYGPLTPSYFCLDNIGYKRFAM